MFSNEVKAYPLCAWLLSAMSAPLAMIAAGHNYLILLPVAVGCGLLCWCIFVLSEGGCCKRRWYCAVQLIWLAVAVAIAANWSGMCWPDGDAYPVVPLVLLVIAAFSAWDGAERASRVGGVVFWFLALLYAVIMAAGSGNIEHRWLKPAVGECSPMLLMALLIPVAITFLPREGARCYTPTLIAISILGFIITIWTVGTLSPQVAESVSFPFYEYSKSMDLFGVAERFEAFVSVALTMGCYSLLSLLLSAAAHLAEFLKAGSGRTAIGACAVAAAALMGLVERIPQLYLGAAALLLWGILPLLAHRPTKKKKVEKN